MTTSFLPRIVLSYVISDLWRERKKEKGTHVSAGCRRAKELFVHHKASKFDFFNTSLKYRLQRTIKIAMHEQQATAKIQAAAATAAAATTTTSHPSFNWLLVSAMCIYPPSGHHHHIPPRSSLLQTHRTTNRMLDILIITMGQFVLVAAQTLHHFLPFSLSSPRRREGEIPSQTGSQISYQGKLINPKP